MAPVMRAPRLEPVGTTPGWRFINSVTLRCRVGRREIRSFEMELPICESVVCSRAPAAAVTSTVWLSAPTSSLKSRSRALLTATVTLATVDVRKAGILTVILYWPGRTPLNRYWPEALAVCAWAALVSLLTSSTDASGTIAPDGSVTVPETAPVVADCAAALEGSNCTMPRKKIDSQTATNTIRACDAANASCTGKIFLNIFISYPPRNSGYSGKPARQRGPR